MVAKPKISARVPGADVLRDVALRYLSRFAATEAGVVRILDRRVERWARIASAEGKDVADEVLAGRKAARQIAQSLVEQGLVNDASFASARANRLARSGKSRKAVAAHLAQKGVQPDTAQAALPGLERELLSALAYIRRRRLGPFKVRHEQDIGQDDHAIRTRELGTMARAGFSRNIAYRALQMPPLEAEAMLVALKQD